MISTEQLIVIWNKYTSIELQYEIRRAKQKERRRGRWPFK